MFQGMLKGFDQTVNLILVESFERVYSTQQGIEQVALGLSLIRGDNVYVQKHVVLWKNISFMEKYCRAVIGDIDEEIDRRLDFANIKAQPLPVIWTV